MSLTTQFLTSIRGFVRDKNGGALRDWLRVGADAPAQYVQLGQELRTGFRGDAAISGLVEKCLPTDEDEDESGAGVPWPGFVSFVKDFLLYWRDVNFADLPALHVQLSGLLTACATALTHPTHGALMLEVSVAVSEALVKLVMMLHHRPDLMLRLKAAGKGGSSSGGDEESKSLVESTADAIQKLFTTCLTDRSSTRWSAPAGKKVAVYRFANLVLKLLFAGNKARWAVQMFTNIASSGPPLHLYPAAQRVTYLYYLGRFYLENNDYVRAARCLEAAYRQTPSSSSSAGGAGPATRKHRRLLLTFLIPANVLLGRFPSEALLLRPEAVDQLRPVYRPLVEAVRRGHFAGVQAVLHNHADWLARHGLLVTLTYRLRPLVWRSLSRRVFLLTYRPPAAAAAAADNDAASGSGRRAAPTLDLADLLTAATFSQHQLEGYVPAVSATGGGGGVLPAARPRPPHTNTLFMRAVSTAAANAAAAESSSSSTLVAPPGGPRRLRPSEGLIWGNLEVTAADVESVVASLVAQGLLHGFVAHAAGKFAVMGAKAKGSAVRAGWPAVAQVIRDRMREEGVDEDNVPAWVETP